MLKSRVKKRATKDIPIFLDRNFIAELEDVILRIEWPYKGNILQLQQRDQGFTALLSLTGLRVSEAVKLKRSQFRIYTDRIELANAETLKHGLLRKRIYLPKSPRARLSRLTRIFEKWLVQVWNPDREHDKGEVKDKYVFPSAKGFESQIDWSKHVDRTRMHQIIFKTTGKFPHWFRAVCETWYGREVFDNNPWKLKSFMGLKRLDSTSDYVQAEWEDDKDKIFH